jgi:transcriptional regulator with XRE-family HTH domain
MSDAALRRRTGATFRGVINDLKRNTEAAAADLGVPPEVITEIIAGERDLPPELLRRAVEVWPVNERDFLPVHDDAPDGVRICRAAESAATSRVFQRGGADYYEYRDTAMSRLSMFRPEWIKMLVPVSDSRPDNPAVQWNKGHFLYQFTYFVGEVNYYYEWEGRRHCVEMTTGDSVAGLPYAPHSFTYREGGSGLILALTYGGRLLGDAHQELGALGADLARHYAVAGETAHATVLRERLDDTMTPVARLAAESGVPRERLDDLLDGKDVPGHEELVALARVLRVSVRDLLPVVGDERDGVCLLRGEEAPAWDWPGEGPAAYRVRGLAGTRICPDSRGLELAVVGRDPEAALLRTGLHQYCFVLGPDPVRLRWESDGTPREEILGPDDSLYVKPFVPHGFTQVEAGRSTVLALRIGGKVAGDTRREASALGAPALRRLISDTTQWYDAAAGTR